MGKRKRWTVALIAVLGLALVPWVGAQAARPTKHWGHPGGGHDSREERQVAVLRVRRHAPGRGRAVRRRRASCPASATCCATACRRRGNGLLTQAPPNTGAGWFTLATGAWPGVHGSTNNTFHVNGAAVRANSHAAAFAPTPNVLQAETLAQAAERGGKKVAQIEWAGGRNGAIDGPTLDFRNFRSGRGVATNYIAPTDLAERSSPSFGAAVRPPGRVRRPAAVPAGRADAATGWTDVPASFSPAKEMRLRVLDGRRRQVRPQRLHLRQQATTTRRATTACCSRAPRTATTRRRPASEGEWADVKVKISGGDAERQDRRRSWSRSSGSTRDLSEVRLFHTSVTRAIATWPNWPGEPGFTGTLRGLRRRALPVLAGRRLRGPRVRDRQRGDLHRAGRSTGSRPTSR